jgi:hypothetical protein
MGDETIHERSRAKRAVISVALIVAAFFGAYLASPIARKSPPKPTASLADAPPAVGRGESAGSSSTAPPVSYDVSGGIVAAQPVTPPAATTAASGGLRTPKVPTGCWRTAVWNFVAEVDGGVQRVSVNMGTVFWTFIWLTPGIPAEIEFGQGVQDRQTISSTDLGFAEDVSAGSKTVSLPGLEEGSYQLESDGGALVGSIIVR